MNDEKKKEKLEDYEIDGAVDETESEPTDIKDVIKSGGSDFSHPLLSDYLEGEREKDGILNSIKLVSGTYGESAILDFGAGGTYRSNGSVVLKQAKQLMEAKKFPYRVHVKIVKSLTSDREYISLI